MKPRFTLIPSGYKDGTIYSILPNNGNGDFNFTRNSEATRINKYGILEVVGVNVPRLDWLDSNCPSLLLEPQRTNLVLFSEQFSGTNWNTINTTITVDQEIAPNGTLTANKLQRTSTSASYRSHNISKSASAITYTTSVFIKKGSDNYFSMRAQGIYPSRVDIRFRFDTEEIYYAQAFSNFTLLDYGVQNYSNGWYRMHFTYTSDLNTNISISFSPRATNGNIDASDTLSTSFAYVWGSQTEVANYVSSYIPTGATSETRLREIAYTDTFNIPNEGVFYAEMKAFTNTYISNQELRLRNQNDAQRVSVRFSNVTNQITAYVNDGTFKGFVTHVVDITKFNKIAYSYTSSKQVLYVNGVEVGNVIDTINLTEQLDEVSTTTDNSGSGSEANMIIKDLRIYENLTEPEILKLTSL